MSEVSRRDFLQLIKRILAATGLTALAAPVLAYFYPPELVETPSEAVWVGKEAEIPLGQSLTIPFGRYPALVIHTSAGFRAYSAVCTHFACICKWDPEVQVIFCPCHAGFFEPLEGEVISGPPPLPLEKIPLNIENGEIYIGGAA
jgi:cytochrome b6-f complex iron-sulfur subunit